MRGTFVLSVVLVGALLLAGCSGSSDSSSSTSGTKSSSGSGTKTTSKAVNATPDLPPILVLKVTDSAGATTNVTTVTGAQGSKGNLTFSAEGSKDADSDGLAAIAITVTDSNSTLPTGNLYLAGKFTPVTYSLSHPGVVNVTVSGIDNRGGLSSIHTQVFVDLITSVKSIVMHAADSSGALVKDTDCTGPTSGLGGGTLVDNEFTDFQKFPTGKGTKWAEATVVSGKGRIHFCTPDLSTAISTADNTHIVSTKGTVFAPTVGDKQYGVFILSNDATAAAGPSGNMVTMSVTIHYEAQP